MSAVYPVSRHRLKVEDFHKMGSAGILTEDDRVELIEGDLIDRAPIGSEHAGVVYYLLTQFSALASHQAAIVGAQNPIIVGEYSEPQPDILILRPREDYYRKSHPRPEDVLLLIEVADSTVRFDRKVKIPLYARHNVPEVWLVDLPRRGVGVYRLPQPDAGCYRQVEFLNAGTLTPQQLTMVSVDLNKLF